MNVDSDTVTDKQCDKGPHEPKETKFPDENVDLDTVTDEEGDNGHHEPEEIKFGEYLNTFQGHCEVGS